MTQWAAQKERGGGGTEETQQLLLETWQEVEAMEEKWSGLSPPPTLQ